MGALVEKQFGGAAADYAASAVHASGPSLGRTLALVSPQPHWHALDVATGAGHTAMAFAPHVASVIASDITARCSAKQRSSPPRAASPTSRRRTPKPASAVSRRKLRSPHLPSRCASLSRVRRLRRRSLARPEAGRHVRARRQRRPRYSAQAQGVGRRAARCRHALQCLRGAARPEPRARLEPR